MKKSVLAATTIALLVTLSAGNVVAQPTHDQLDSANGPIHIRPVQHGTLVLEWDGKSIYVDPVGGVDAFEELSPPDLILITDIHGDHMDTATVIALRQAKTAVVAPAAVASEFPAAQRDRVRVLANGETLAWEGAAIEAMPMYNLTKERLRFHTKGRGNGYVLTLGGKRIYISGDTEDIPEMRALEGIDAAFVCMNLPYTMTVEQAANAVLEFKPEIVYPYHYRGRGGMSDVEKFRSLVSKNPKVEVRLLKWY